MRARNALVKPARNFRIYLAHVAVELGELALKIHRHRRHHGHDYEHAQRQQRVEHKHDYRRAQRVRHVPHARIHVPREYGRNDAGVAHHARVQLADAVLIEIRYRQRLQMVERRPAHVAQQEHFQTAAAVRAEVVEHHRNHVDRRVRKREREQAVERLFGDKVVDSVHLKQRRYRIEHAHRQCAKHERGENAAVRAQVRAQLAQAEKPELFFGLYFLFGLNAFSHCSPPRASLAVKTFAGRKSSCKCRCAL